MADTMTIRMNEDIQEAFKKLAEENEQNYGDFLNHLITKYRTDKTKENVPILQQAILSVDELTDRIKNILNGTGEQILTNEEKYKREFDEQKKSFDETRELLQQQITSLKEERQAYEEQIQEFIAEKEISEQKIEKMKEQTIILENSIGDKKALVEQYIEKNDTLNGIINNYKEAEQENKTLKETVSTLENKLKELSNVIEQQKISIEQQKANFEISSKEQDINKNTEILELKQKHDEKLDEARQELSELRQKYDNKIEEMQSKYENKISELLKLEDTDKQTISNN